MIRDITKSKKLKDLKKASNYKSILFATTSHELRNPLNGIISMLEVIRPSISSQMMKYINIASSSSQLMLSLVNQIMDYAQLQEGKLILNIKSCNIGIAIRECVELMECKA